MKINRMTVRLDRSQGEDAPEAVVEIDGKGFVHFPAGVSLLYPREFEFIGRLVALLRETGGVPSGRRAAPEPARTNGAHAEQP